MINPSEKQIKEIAELLDSGMKCFYNINTHEIKAILDFDSNDFIDPGVWQDLIDELEKHSHEYVEFKKMTSFESFKVMEAFIEEIDDGELRKRLIWILNKQRPFRNFNDEIDYNGDYQEKWFEFKLMKNIEWVEEQISVYNGRNEEGQEIQDEREK